MKNVSVAAALLMAGALCVTLAGCGPRAIYPVIYVDNATTEEITVEVDGENCGLVTRDAYQKYDTKRMKPGPHTFVIRKATDQQELERRTETIDGYGPWVLNVAGAQTYLRVSDYDFQAKDKFDIKDGHRQRWFEANGFDIAATSPVFGMFYYDPKGTRLLRWSQIPDSRKVKTNSNAWGAD